MSTVSLVGTPAIASNTGTNSPSVAGSWGTGLSRTAPNLLVAVVSMYGTGSAVISDPPSGWMLRDLSEADDTLVAVYTKVAAGSDSAPTFTGVCTGTAGDQRMDVTLLEYSDSDGGTPIFAACGIAQGTSGATLTTTSRQSSPPGSAFYSTIIVSQGTTAGTASWTPPSGWTAGPSITASFRAQTANWSLASSTSWVPISAALPKGRTTTTKQAGIIFAIGPAGSKETGPYFDSIVSKTASTSTNTSISHTSVQDHCAFVLSCSVGDPSFGAGADTITATLDGSSMTSLGTREEPGPGGDGGGFVQLFGLPDIASGAHTVTVTVAGGATLDLNLVSMAIAGTDRTSPFGTQQAAQGQGTAPTVSITGTVGNLIVGPVCSGNTQGAGPTGQSRIYVHGINSSSGGGVGECMFRIATGASDTMASVVGTDDWAIAAVEVKALRASRVAPTFVADYPSADWTGTASPKTEATVVATGDVLVDVAGRENTNATLATPTGGSSITWDQLQALSAGSFGGASIWKSQPSGQSYTNSQGSGGSSGSAEFGFDIYRYSGSDGLGVSKQASGTSGAATFSLTTTRDNSAIVLVITDWNSVDGASRVWATVNGITPTAGNGYERVYQRTAGNYTAYSAYYPDVGTAGPKTIGITTPSSGMNWAVLAVEVFGQDITPVSGTGSINLKKASLSGSGTAGSGGVTGTGSIRLKKPSLSASGKETESGTGSIRLKKPALSAVGNPNHITGSGSVGLKKPALSVSAEEFISGLGGVSLKKPSLSASGKETESGTSSIRLKKPGLSGTGTQKGFGGVHLHKPSLSASGTVTTLSGVGSVALHKLSLAASGTEKISGTGSVGLKKPALSAAAVEKEAGSGSVNLHKPAISVTGNEKFIATGSCGLKKLSLAASGGETISGTGSVSLHKLVIALAAPQPVTGTGSAGLKKPYLIASGTEKFIGTGSAGLKKPGISLTSTEIETGTGDIHLHKMSIAASGSEKISATGSIHLHKMSVSAAGPQNSIGSGGVYLHKMDISAGGFELIEGSGGVTLKKPRVHAAQASIPANALFAFWPV